MEERMKDRMKNLSKGGCAICGVKAQNHKAKYDKNTGTTTDFTHSFDGGNFEDFKFKINTQQSN